MYAMNKKKTISASIEVYKTRINQLDEKLKGQNLSNEQRGTFESEKIIATKEILKLESTK